MSGELQCQKENLVNIINTLEENGKDYTADDIVDEYEKTYRNKDSVFSFFRKNIIMLNEAGRHSTADRYHQTLNSFMSFRGGYDLHFYNVTPQLTLAYETWLRNNHLCRNTTPFFMRIMRTLYYKVVKANLTVDLLPFNHVYTGIDKDRNTQNVSEMPISLYIMTFKNGHVLKAKIAFLRAKTALF